MYSMEQDRRERRTHGTQAFPFQIYPSEEFPQSDLVPCHWHPESEIIRIEKNEVELMIGSQSFTGKEGDVFFVRSSELHEIRGGSTGTFHSFVFPMGFLQFSQTDLVQNEYLEPLASGQLIFKTVPDPETAGMIGSILTEIVDACAGRSAGYQLLVKADLLRITALAAERKLLAAGSGHISDYRQKTLREIITCLEKHYDEKISLEEISGRFGMTPPYFCTFFKRNLGRTFTQHLNFLRTERASRLLEETDRKVTDIALSVGFENTSYFIKRFRQSYGMSPEEYRKSRGEGQERICAGKWKSTN